jgi:glyoxylase-like metal-dependent hydrolase (beta-lactamase superfamily II)
MSQSDAVHPDAAHPGAVPNTTTRASTVTDGVHFVQGPAVNWIIVEGELGPILIDTGYPGDGAAVTAALGALGYAVEDVHAILLTHGHGDHIGNAAFIAGLADCDVLAARDEIPNVRRDVLEQVGLADVQPHLERPGVASWLNHAVEAGGLEVVAPTAVVAVEAVPELRGALGVEIRPIPLPGHTRGHLGFLLVEHGVLVAGDALITAHLTSPHDGPQLLPEMFHGDLQRARQSLTKLAGLPASIVLPGHGPAFFGSPAQAAAEALAFGSAF